MAAFTGIRSVSASIVAYLNARWETEPLPGGAPGDLLRDDLSGTIELVSSGQLATENVSFDNTLTLWLYRVTVNEQLRNSTRAARVGNPRISGAALTPVKKSRRRMCYAPTAHRVVPLPSALQFTTLSDAIPYAFDHTCHILRCSYRVPAATITRLLSSICFTVVCISTK